MKGTSTTQTTRTCLGLALLLIVTHILNNLIFPHFDRIAPEARDISTYCGILFFLLLVFIAYRIPSIFHEKAWTAGAFALILIGFMLLYLGVTTETGAFLIAGSPFGSIGSAWFTVLVCTSLTKLDPKACTLCIPSAFVIQYAAIALLSILAPPLLASLILSLACSATLYSLIIPYAKDSLKTIQSVKPVSELDVTNPSSFLPFSSPVFISIIIFNIAGGFTLTFLQTDIPFAYTTPAFIPLLLILGIVLFRKKELNADKVFLTAALLVFGGFLLAPLALSFTGNHLDTTASIILFRAGTDCFSLLMYLLIARVGSRNELSTVPMVALTMGSSWLGIAIGALLGQGIAILALDNFSILLGALGIMTFLFVVYNFVALKGFSFEKTIQGIQPVAKVNETPETPPEELSRFEDDCETVIKEYGLTQREGDVLKLLAKGRTSPVIQEKLFLSHNTVKTHVRHIYTKMEIHSQQELIDKVESKGNTDITPNA